MAILFAKRVKIVSLLSIKINELDQDFNPGICQVSAQFANIVGFLLPVFLVIKGGMALGNCVRSKEQSLLWHS